MTMLAGGYDESLDQYFVPAWARLPMYASGPGHGIGLGGSGLPHWTPPSSPSASNESSGHDASSPEAAFADFVDFDAADRRHSISAKQDDMQTGAHPNDSELIQLEDVKKWVEEGGPASGDATVLSTLDEHIKDSIAAAPTTPAAEPSPADASIPVTPLPASVPPQSQPITSTPSALPHSSTPLIGMPATAPLPMAIPPHHAPIIHPFHPIAIPQPYTYGPLSPMSPNPLSPHPLIHPNPYFALQPAFTTSPTPKDLKFKPTLPTPPSSPLSSSRPASKAVPSTTPNGRASRCHNCGTTTTPLWRRTPDRKFSLCNACGLYFKQYGYHRGGRGGLRGGGGVGVGSGAVAGSLQVGGDGGIAAGGVEGKKDGEGSEMEKDGVVEAEGRTKDVPPVVPMKFPPQRVRLPMDEHRLAMAQMTKVIPSVVPRANGGAKEQHHQFHLRPHQSNRSQ
ncbi:hypothetical protein HDV00_009336 [Rhizophlyctis rosea]|nr:hypothetical protein HDV00_009336 [Rhizophlyctis rosea]